MMIKGLHTIKCFIPNLFEGDWIKGWKGITSTLVSGLTKSETNSVLLLLMVPSQHVFHSSRGFPHIPTLGCICEVGGTVNACHNQITMIHQANCGKHSKKTSYTKPHIWFCSLRIKIELGWWCLPQLLTWDNGGYKSGWETFGNTTFKVPLIQFLSLELENVLILFLSLFLDHGRLFFFLNLDLLLSNKEFLLHPNKILLLGLDFLLDKKGLSFQEFFF